MDTSLREQLRSYDGSPSDEQAHKLVALFRRSTELPPEPDSADVWVLLLSTIRYSLGRSTYMTSVCTEFYHRYKHFLTENQRSQVRKEIKQELDRATGSNQFLGMEMDHKEWQNLVDSIN